MSPHEIKLPNKIEDLITFYMIVNHRLNNVWLEYTSFVESLNILPKTLLIFPIIFAELDFYEVLLERIKQKLPEEAVREIHDEFFFSDW